MKYVFRIGPAALATNVVKPPELPYAAAVHAVGGTGWMRWLIRHACIIAITRMHRPMTISIGRVEDPTTAKKIAPAAKPTPTGIDHRFQVVPACVMAVPDHGEDVAGEQDRQRRAGNQPAADDGGDDRSRDQRCSGERRLRQADDQSRDAAKDQVARGEHRRSLRWPVPVLRCRAPRENVLPGRCDHVACAATLPAFFDNPQIPERRR